MDNIETNYTVMSKKEINSYRHKSERRWYRALVIINFLAIFAVAGACFASMDKNTKYFKSLQNDFYAVQTEIMQEADRESSDSADSSAVSSDTVYKVEKGNEGTVSKDINSKEIGSENLDAEDSDDESAASDKLEKRIDKFPEDIKILAFMIFVIVLMPFAASYVYAMYRSMSVKVTEKNFPEIYEIVKEYTERLGLKKMPNTYIIQGNGVLNAFSSFIPFKQYVELYADLVEVAYREHKDMDSLKFIIGHEMAHIRLKHATLHYNILIAFADRIPILGSTASRAREYSCDRIAQHLSGSDGIDAMMTLTAGIHLYKKVDKDDYIENAKKINGFFLWCCNLLADHPVTCKRILALEMKEGSGKLY